MVGFHAPTLSRPDTPGFLFPGYVKQIMYSARIHNIKLWKQAIKEAAASVTADVLGGVWQEMEYRLDVCRATNGAHTELR
jgi:hypothetical protein